MKKFSYNNRGSSLRSIAEIEMKKRKNWDRIIYLVILWAILGSLLFYVGKKTLFVFSSGELVTEGFKIKFMEDVKVSRFYVNQDDFVNVGDTLFYFTPSEDYDTLQDEQENFLADDWYNREIINTEKSIGLKNTQIQEKQRQYSSARSDLRKLEKEVYLDISNQSEVDKKKIVVDGLSSEISGLKKEVEYLENYKKQLEERMAEKGELLHQRNVMSRNLYYTSPVAGKVNLIHRRPGEINYKGEIVMEVIDPKNVTVAAYVKQSDIGDFKIGSRVRIEFPGGEMSSGKVSFISYTAQEMPLYLQNPTDPNNMRLKIIVEPWDEEHRKEWPLHYSNLGVKVFKTKRFLDFLF
ncbi:HlyD family secretion protein [Saccharicrinis sp. FJH54]|uniref:HlyD family secretion protein n=1 Tax=Saccharicrinis sp. FJH54 TaxID=3344665 RepID=UPI0035D508C3